MSQVPQATEQLPQDMFNVDEDDRERYGRSTPVEFAQLRFRNEGRVREVLRSS